VPAKKPSKIKVTKGKSVKAKSVRDILTDLAVKDALKKERAKNSKKTLGVAPNMAAAAARTGLHPDVVKEAKGRGCTAFHQSGRVDCDALLEYVVSNPQLMDGTEDRPNRALEEALLIRTNRLLREEKLLDVRHKVIRKVEMAQRVRAIAMEQKAILEKHLNQPDLVLKICAAMRPLVETWLE
jgi:hypothetical protein